MVDRVAFLNQLADLLGPAGLLCEEADKAVYLTDWRGRYRGDAVAVARPETTGQVAAVVRFCAAAGVSVVPQGGNTGLCGGATPVPGDVSLLVSLSRMNQIIAVDPGNNTLLVEAGCTLAAVQAAAREVGRYFPLSLASEGSCQIGGNLSTNAGGVQVLRYGNMREQVLGLEVVLPDGRIWDGLRALRKDNTGYDLKHVFIGAEGTLGIITAAILKMQPYPGVRATGWVGVPTATAALDLLALAREQCGDRVSAFELVSNVSLSLVLKHIQGARHPLPDDRSDWSVLIELSDCCTDEELMRMLERTLVVAAERGVVSDAMMASTLAQRSALWALRENISEAQRLEGFSIKHDVAVPVSRIPEFLRRAESALRSSWPDLRIVAFGHVGDGNLHYNLSKPDAIDNQAFLALSPAVSRVVHDLVTELDGTISAEHGIGQLKRDELGRYKSEVELDLMGRIKHVFDPEGLMNPGKLI